MKAPRDHAADAIREINHKIQSETRGSGKRFRDVEVQVADYADQEDLNFFKGGQGWTIPAYEEAIADLERMCKESGFGFKAEVFRASTCQDYLTQHGLIGDVGQKIAFILSILGADQPPDTAPGAYGLSPFLLRMTSDIPFTQNKPLIFKHVITT